MKLSANLFLIFFILFLSQEVLSQTDHSIKLRNVVKEQLTSLGYKLLDEGGMYGDGVDILGTDERTYYSGKKYIFIGIIDNCSDCYVSIKYANVGEIPAYIPDLEAEIERDQKRKLTRIIYVATFENTSKGYFLLFNNSITIKRYIYSLLFVRDED